MSEYPNIIFPFLGFLRGEVHVATFKYFLENYSYERRQE